MRPVGSLCHGRARKIQRKARPGSDTGLSSLGLPVAGCVWDHERLLPDYLPSSDLTTPPLPFPCRTSSWSFIQESARLFLFNLQEFFCMFLLLERHPVNLF